MSIPGCRHFSLWLVLAASALAPPASPPVTFLTVPLNFVLSEVSEELNCLPAFVSDRLDWLPVFLTLPAANVLGATLLPAARTLTGVCALNGVLSSMPKLLFLTALAPS